MPSKTPLFEWHKTRGAKIVDFGGWDMPLWYPSGAVAEHVAVVTGCGLFDTSHMAVVTVKGPSALDLINLCFSKHLRLRPETGPKPAKCFYGVFLDPSGGVIDDAIVYPRSDRDFMIVVNAGMGDKIARHLQANDSKGEQTIVDLTGRVGKMDLQGPLAARVMMKLLENPEQVLKDLTYFSFKGNLEPQGAATPVKLSGGPEILLSRTGYTGEFGFEIFTSGENLVSVWEMIVEAGREYGLIPCGLAARDSLRAGAVLPLSHQDIGPWPFINNPWTFALPFNPEGTGFTKEFIGSRALDPDRAEWTLPFLGSDPRKVAAGDQAVVLDPEDREIGVVLTCVGDMAIGRSGEAVFSLASPAKPDDFKPRGLVCGFVKVKTRIKAGETVYLKDKRRKLEVKIVKDIRPDRTARQPMEKMTVWPVTPA